MRWPYRCLATTLAFLSATSAPLAQQVNIVRITDETTRIRGFGDRPALHDGLVAFYGYRTRNQITAVFLTPADGQGPFTVVANLRTEIPNFPGKTFDKLSNPSIHDGVVAFTGGRDSSPSWIDDGIYLGDGGPLSVLYDTYDASGKPAPGVVGLGPQGASWRESFKPGERTGDPFFTPFGEEHFFTGDSSLPGGGRWAGMNGINSNPAQGAGKAIFSIRVSHDSTSDGGIYTYDVVSRSMDVVANWNTPMPGSAEQFEWFSHADTDGAHAAFVGQRGVIFHGGVQGVYLADLDGDPTDPVTRIAETGDTPPGSSEAISSFQEVAIDGGLVVFSALLGPTGAEEGLYGWYEGQLFKIVDTWDVLVGEVLIGFDMNFRGLDRGQLAFRATFLDPNFPNYALRFGTFVATIDLPICQENLGYGGPGRTLLRVCGQPLSPGNAAELSVSGAAPSAPGLLLVGLQSNPTPFGGGTLVPIPWIVAIPFPTDPAGEVLVPFTAPPGGPLAVFGQFAVIDPTWPSGIDLSNTVRLALLP